MLSDQLWVDFQTLPRLFDFLFQLLIFEFLRHHDLCSQLRLAQIPGLTRCRDIVIELMHTLRCFIVLFVILDHLISIFRGEEFHVVFVDQIIVYLLFNDELIFTLNIINNLFILWLEHFPGWIPIIILLL